MPPKVISQASALLQTAEKRCKKLHLFSADEHTLLLYVGEGRLFILIPINVLVGGILFDFS